MKRSIIHFLTWCQPEKTADISLRHHRFPREMTSEKRAQKFHTDDTNQKHYQDLRSDAPSVLNFCARFSDVMSRGNRSWSGEMSAVFSDYRNRNMSWKFARVRYLSHPWQNFFTGRKLARFTTPPNFCAS